jgi:hypothetical protein
MAMNQVVLYFDNGRCSAFHCRCEFDHVRRREAPQQGCRGQGGAGDFESQSNYDRDCSEHHLKGGTKS